MRIFGRGDSRDDDETYVRASLAIEHPIIPQQSRLERVSTEKFPSLGFLLGLLQLQ